ncbi:hypothetical protein RX411_09415 [Faecalibacterium prausnitzii]|nr:hypothetical protein [Faecalibacterium prausnitzii]
MDASIAVSSILLRGTLPHTLFFQYSTTFSKEKEQRKSGGYRFLPFAFTAFSREKQLRNDRSRFGVANYKNTRAKRQAFKIRRSR